MIQYDKLSAPLQDLYNRVYAATLTECMKYDASGQGVFDHERAASEAEKAVRQVAPDVLKPVAAVEVKAGQPTGGAHEDCG